MKNKFPRFFRFGKTVILSVCVLAAIGSVKGQSITDGSTPSGIAPGSPAGSYALGGFDNINLYNGHLDVRPRLLQVGGRGGAGMTVGVSLNPAPWVVKGLGVTHDWWSIKPGYGPGVMVVRRIGLKYDGPGQACPQDGLNHYRWTRTAVTFTASDGTEFELRDKINNQALAPWIDSSPNYCSTGPTRGTEFVTTDGTSATFISDSVIIDRNRYYTNTEQIIFPSGYLVLRDGTRYRISNGLVDWIRDRNGNRLSFTYGLNSSDPLTYRKVLTITDALNRVVSFQYFTNYDVISFKGFNGTGRTITINRSLLSTALRGDFFSQGVKKPSELFPGITPEVNEAVYNPSVITSITMPDGRSYQIAYNQYAEVARVVLPTGGAIGYDMVPGSGLVSDESTGQIVYQIYRRIGKRREYANQTDTIPVQLMTYSAGPGNVTVDHLDPLNGDQLLARDKHYFYGDPVASLFVQQPSVTGYLEGREYQTEFFSVINGVAGNPLRKVENLWEPGVPVTAGGPACNARVKETTSTLVDTNQVSKQIFGYDDSLSFNNQNNVKEYDLGTGAPGALLRETRTTYVTSTNYTGTNVSLLGLASQISVFDGNGIERARMSFEYDNYNTDTYHAGLIDRSNISGFDSSFSTSYATRGNVTASTQYLLVNGSVTGSVASYAQYDVAGNAVKAIDALGYATNVDFTDRFGSPDGEARNNSGASELGGQLSYAFPTLVTNAAGHTAYTQFDYYLGRPIDSEDANGIVSSAYYNDLLDRPKQTIRAVNGGTDTKSQTTIAYDDANRVITTTSDLNLFNDPNPLKSQVLYDGLGRTIESRQYEGGSNYIAAQIQYDALGRAYKTSNPFRPWQGASAVWTTTAFDALGRLTSVTTPDSAVVTTAYNGERVLVADQAGKKRISKTDGLGRLKDVWEVTAADSATEALSFPGFSDVVAGYRTSYNYDTLNNLTTVNQGSQTRTFVYDSLKRLSSATKPESGTVSYSYDNNGNLTQKTDARGIWTVYGYDALNRNTAISYSDGVTMGIGRAYDQTAYGKGRLSWEWQCLDATHCGSAESFNYDALGRVVNRNQAFYTNGTLGANFGIYATYDLAGNLKTETYPSNHTVTYNYDGAGRLADNGSNLALTGNLGDGVTRTYSKGITYDAGSRMTRELFGTDTLLYHNSHYNVRGQLYDTRVGSGTDGNGSEFTWNRGCLQMFYESSYTWGASGASNNGNLLRSLQYLPNNDQITSFSMNNEDYTYDSLNRLTSASEAGPIYTQSYIYDRWGNRTIDYNNSSSNFPRPQFVVNTSNNRLGVPSGQSGTMTYDNAGNLINDTYSGQGQRIYDGENRITAAQDNYSAWSYYSYDAGGNRVRRKINNQETWQIYGIGGELLAEYAANASPSSPQKEYGYRSGQLLVTATNTTNDIQWLVGDQLGTPRMIFDKTGSLAGTKRHDYLPFGEELYAGIGSRSAALGYGVANDGVRQKFTQKERDNETGLDYFGARYYGSTQGRFTGADPLLSSGDEEEPQSWNRYSYVLNNPLKLIDPDGLYVFDSSVSDEQRKKFNEALGHARASLWKVAAEYGVKSKEFKMAQRALNAYGDLGVKNGVTIFATQSLGNAAGNTATEGVRGAITSQNPTGQNTHVTFAAATFDSASFGEGIGHEGSHVAHGTNWVKSGFANSANPTAYQFEVDGYSVQSILAEAAVPKGNEYAHLPYFQEPGKAPYVPETAYIWRSEWAGADRATLAAFRKNVDNVLGRPKKAGGYGLTPTSTKPAFLRGSKFPR